MVTDTKYCPGCDTTQSLASFHKNKARKDGVQSLCKPCFKAAQQKYIDNNKEAQLTSLRRWRESNAGYFKSYRAANLHRAASRQRVRYAKKKQAMPPWLSETQLGEIANFYWLANDLGKVSGEVYHVDHIVPLQGENVCGLHVPWNLQILPADLNISKHNKLIGP